MKVQNRKKIAFAKTKKYFVKKTPKSLKITKKVKTINDVGLVNVNHSQHEFKNDKVSKSKKKIQQKPIDTKELEPEENYENPLLENNKKGKQKKEKREETTTTENSSSSVKKKTNKIKSTIEPPPDSESKDTKKKSKSAKDSKSRKNKREETQESESDNEKEQLTKKQLEGIKDIDPEFYKFLKQNDKKLLDFCLENSDSDDESVSKENTIEPPTSDEGKEENDDDDDDEDDDDEKFHKPSAADLDVASDESDFEKSDHDDDDNESSQKITLNLLRQWELQLQQDKVTIDIIRNIIKGFSSALASISSDTTENAAYTVSGAPVFNGVIQLCVLHLHPAILKFLGLNTNSKIPLHKTKKWPKLRSCLRDYLMDLIHLIEHVSSPNILSVLLKHLHQVAGILGSYSSICKPMLKRLIVLWSTSDETVRVLAFLCILKITRNQQDSMLNHVLKTMYMSYVRNSKFVSPNTLPSINFMRRSLVEMFALDLNATYQHAFLFIRQLAIHLRNAVILKKKDSFQAVYNWQYINSIKLWTELLGATANKPQLQPLVYPLITIIIGVIKLIPTAQYFPLRFHCAQTLITLAKQTRTFIPVLPLILEVLKSNTFNKKHTIVSMKPMSFACILRLNKSQLAENGFRDETVENLCGLILEYLAHESASMAYTDLIVPIVINLKKYLKVCKNSNYSRKIKTLLDKMQENSKFIENERRKINFALKDTALVQSWEDQVKNKGTPLDVYYTSWVRTHEKKKRRIATDSENINDYDLPVIKKKKIDGNCERDGEVELFPTDSEDDGPTVSPGEKKKERKKKKKDKVIPESAPKTKEPEVEDEDDVTADCVDIVEDLNLDDW